MVVKGLQDHLKNSPAFIVVVTLLVVFFLVQMEASKLPSERQWATELTRQSLMACRVSSNAAGTPAVGTKMQLASRQTDLNRHNLNWSKVDCEKQLNLFGADMF